jgi:hypothetical protein
LPLDDRQGADLDGGFEFTVPRVKVWRPVIIEEHSNQDPIEPADRRHSAMPILPPSTDHSPQVGIARRDLLQGRPGFALIVASRHVDEALRAEVLNLGGSDVLEKPFAPTAPATIYAGGP